MLLICISVVYAAIPSGYYNSAEDLSGTSLRLALHNIIDDHIKVSYTPGVWNAFGTTDLKDNGKVWDMYTHIEWTYQTDQQTTGSTMAGSYNREHSWPKSWFGDDNRESYYGYTDLYHLYPVQGTSNSTRNNNPYGEVGVATYTSANGSKSGSARDGLGYSGTVFEPIDEYKGDLARTYFYMCTRYYTEDANWSDVEMSNKTELKPWALDMLLEWHENDPVSQKELDRIEAVFAIQENRNPFIDHPEYVQAIWDPNWSGISVPVATAATSVDETGFTANWETVNTATGYYLYVSGSSDFASHVGTYNEKDMGNTTSASVSGLTHSSTYYYRVKAYNDSYSSTYSNTITANTDLILSSPTAQAASSVGITNFTANWTSVDNASSYLLDVSTQSDFSTFVSTYEQKNTGNVSSYAVSGLNSNTPYYYRVMAIAATDSSELSNTISITTNSPSDGGVFISEYIEGSSYNKAIEIFNNTGAAIDLSQLTLSLCPNGAATPEKNMTFSGTLENRAAYVVCHKSSDADILAVANKIEDPASVIYFNGDDVVQLYYNGELVDCIGNAPHPNDNYFVKDVTLVRKAEYISGSTTYSETEWDSYAKDTFSYLGSHTAAEAATPIVLSDFTARYEGESVILDWTTASELENAHFNIYRNDSLINSVLGSGTSSETHSYSYTDSLCTVGSNTYCLASYSYSNVETRFDSMTCTVMIQSTDIADLPGSFYLGSPYPNPFNPITHLPLDLEKNTDVSIQVYSLEGKSVMKTKTLSLSAGSHDLVVDGSKLTTGIYIVSVSTDDTVRRQKISLVK